MADKLLVEKGGKPMGINWPNRFITRKEKLKTCQTRVYDCQRALYKDSGVIKAWFKLYNLIKEKYGILNKGSYNFNKTGFIIGVITS